VFSNNADVGYHHYINLWIVTMPRRNNQVPILARHLRIISVTVGKSAAGAVSIGHGCSIARGGNYPMGLCFRCWRRKQYEEGAITKDGTELMFNYESGSFRRIELYNEIN
jgi:hypothetical protein